MMYDEFLANPTRECEPVAELDECSSGEEHVDEQGKPEISIEKVKPGKLC